MNHNAALKLASDRQRFEKRQRILRAAAKVWHRRALAMASMDEIASEAGVSKGTLYNFFRNKEDLFVATVMAPYDDFLENFTPKIDEIDDPSERLQVLFDSLCTIFHPVSDHLNLQYQAWSVIVRDPAARDRMFEALRRVYAGFYRGTIATLEEGIKRGQFRADIDVSLVATSWISMFDGMSYRTTFDPGFGGRSSATSVLRDCLELQLQQISTKPAHVRVGGRVPGTEVEQMAKLAKEGRSP